MVYSNKIEDSMRVSKFLQISIAHSDALSVVFKFALVLLIIYEGVTSYDFSYANTFWIGAAVVALLIPLTLWKEKANE